jgi:eukaryotic-like serine/threonine-protein kinase
VPQLRGDPDNIVLMALRTEPERCYQSVEQFSEDIRRHLEAVPVVARKDTLTYRGAKLVRRNPTLTAVVTARLLFALAVVWLLQQQFAVPPKSPAPEKSIAVLPFKNVGKDKANAYFADGIQEESLTGLSRITDLKVISRASTERYTGPLGISAMSRSNSEAPYPGRLGPEGGRRGSGECSTHQRAE